MNVGRLKNKVRNQAAAITQLLECAKADKNLVETFKKTNTMLKGENEDLRVRCDEVEEMLRQTESNLEIANKERLEVLELNEQILKEKQKVEYKLVTQNHDITKYQETIEELQKMKLEEKEIKSMYFNALNLKIKECKELEKQLEEARKPWWRKKLLKC